MAKLPDKSIDMVLCDLPCGTTARNKLMQLAAVKQFL